jgi:predicted nucleotidyltransferase
MGYRPVKLPSNIQQVLDQAVGALKERLRDNLYSCILYGSAVRGEWVPGAYVNLLIVLNESTPEAHQTIADTIRGPVLIEPFVLRREGIERSFQAFALKFRSIRRNYKVLQGADLLSGLHIDESLLRFLCEQALRNLRLRLTHAFISFGRDSKRYTRCVIEAVPDLMADLGEVLRSVGEEPPKEYSERIPLLEKKFGMEASVLQDLLKLKAEERKIGAAEIFSFHSRLFRLLNHVVQWIESQWPPLKLQRQK